MKNGKNQNDVEVVCRGLPRTSPTGKVMNMANAVNEDGKYDKLISEFEDWVKTEFGCENINLRKDTVVGGYKAKYTHYMFITWVKLTHHQ